MALAGATSVDASPNVGSAIGKKPEDETPFARVLRELMAPNSEIEPAALAIIDAPDIDTRRVAILDAHARIGARFALHRESMPRSIGALCDNLRSALFDTIHHLDAPNERSDIARELGHTPLRGWPRGVADIVMSFIPPKSMAFRAWDKFDMLIADSRDTEDIGNPVRKLANLLNCCSPQDDPPIMSRLALQINRRLHEFSQMGHTEHAVALVAVKTIAIGAWAPLSYVLRRAALCEEKGMPNAFPGPDPELSFSETWLRPGCSDPENFEFRPSPRDWSPDRLLECLAYQHMFPPAMPTVAALMDTGDD